MDKEQFLNEVRRIAQENGGTPPGSRSFYAQTDTRESTWIGKPWNEWNNWNDVLEEAGYVRRIKNQKLPTSNVLEELALLTKKLGRFPVTLDMRREKRTNSNFPNDKTLLTAFGSREESLKALKDYCSAQPHFSELLPILERTILSSTFKSDRALNNNVPDDEPMNIGYIYLIKSHDVYKIGCTRAPYRRAAEIANQSARGAELLHLISTDDPEGIEKYWHRRFADQAVQALNKASGEWFHLTAADIKAIKQRKFM
jgi:hypothetical protein